MAAPMHVQLHNAESAILFMQQEHAKTLQGLHQELQKLQKKCAELTFELAMKSEAPDEESYVKQQKVLEAQLKEKATECEEVKREIEHRDTRISRLEQQVKDQERHHQAVIKQHQQQMLMLSRELEQRSSSIAYLTTQLHQLKLRQQSRGGEEVGPANEWAGTPTPPKDKPHHMRRHKVRSTSVGLENVKVPVRAVHPSGLDHSGLLDYASYVAEAGTTPQYIVRTRRSGSAGPHHHNSATHSRTDIMNLQPFLAKGTDHSRDTLRPTPPPVLPPITSSEDRNRNLLDKRTVFSKRGVHRSNTEFEQAVATETLAVEQVCLREKGLRQLEQSKSD